MAKKELLRVKSLGLAFGIVCAAYIFIVGIGSMYGWGESLVKTISSLYVGYDGSLIGSFIGAIYAFVDGFIAGAIVAWLYNRF